MPNSDEGAALSTSDFWNARYEKSDGDQPTHEWFRSFEALEKYFTSHLFKPFPARSNPRIIHLGSGDSTIPYDLLNKGYSNQLCVDFSQVVVDLMTARRGNDTGVIWQNADVRHMSEIASNSFDVAFDKGTLDAMIHGSPWDPPDDVRENTQSYISEIFRILRPGGVFLYVTFRQPHFIKPLLRNDSIGAMHMENLAEEGSFDYYGFVLTKSDV